MSSLWDNAFEQQKVVKLDGTLQVCKRCKLPFPIDSKECTHCANVDDNQLEQLRKQFNSKNSGKKVQKRITIVW